MENFKFLLFACLLLFSCKNDPCDDVVCANEATCLEGICDCTEGYEGTLCDVEMRSNFYGTWWGSHGCSEDEFFGELTLLIESGAEPLTIQLQEQGETDFITATIEPNVLDAYAFEFELNEEDETIFATGELKDSILAIVTTFVTETDTTYCYSALAKI